MVDMIGEPGGPDRTRMFRASAPRGAGTKSTPLSEVIRKPDPGFKGQYLYAGQSIGDETWKWFRLPGFSLRQRTIDDCVPIGVCDGNEAARLKDHFGCGGFRLEQFKLGGEIRVLVAV